MPKRERARLHPRHQVKLDTVRGVAIEQGRIYRLYLNDRIKAGEMTKVMFSLREIRCSLEAIPIPPDAERRVDINIVSVPSGHYFREVDAVTGADRLLTIEHLSAAEANVVPEHSAEIIDRAQEKIAEPADEIQMADEPAIEVEAEPKTAYQRMLKEACERRNGHDEVAWTINPQGRMQRWPKPRDNF